MNVKVYVATDETCWAEMLPAARPGLPHVRLLNIPITDKYNVLDVISVLALPVDDVSGSVTLHADQLIDRKYANKSCVEYGEPFHKNFKSLVAALNGCKIEGMMHGVMLVAHNGADVAKLIAPVGRLSKIQPRLHNRT